MALVWLTFWLTNAPDIGDIGDISTLPMLGMPGRVTATTMRGLIRGGWKGGLLPVKGQGHGGMVMAPTRRRLLVEN